MAKEGWTDDDERFYSLYSRSRERYNDEHKQPPKPGGGGDDKRKAAKDRRQKEPSFEYRFKIVSDRRKGGDRRKPPEAPKGGK